jgi:hypothetical protein
LPYESFATFFRNVADGTKKEIASHSAAEIQQIASFATLQFTVVKRFQESRMFDLQWPRNVLSGAGDAIISGLARPR